MIVCKRSLYPLHAALFTNLMYVTFVMDINETKKYILVIQGSGTLGDSLLLFEEGMGILLSNSDGDGRGRRHTQNIRDG